MSDLRKYGTRRDRYAYKRMIIGLQWYREKNFIIRFLTLTGVSRGKGWRRNFDKLRNYLRKRFGKFEYFAVRTDEGTYGVLHILFVGKAFRYGELSKWWAKQTGYWSIHISRVKDFKGIGFEMTRQNKVARYSQSRNWFKNKTKEEDIWFEGTSLMSKKIVKY